MIEAGAPSQSGPRDDAALRRLALAGIFAFVATAAFLPLDNNDVWIHLVTGRLILDEGTVPRVDRYTEPTAGARYVAHEWLAATYYAAAEALAGIPAVVWAAKALPALCAVAVLGLALRASRAPPGVGLPLVLLAVTVLRFRILARPELIAIPILLGALWLLLRDREAARAGCRTRALWLLVPLEVLWVNVHGSFPLGIVLVGGFAAAEAIERAVLGSGATARGLRIAGVAGGLAVAAFVATLEPRAFALPAALLVASLALLFAADGAQPILRREAFAPGQGLLRLGLLALLMLVATLANPLGPEILLFPFEFTAESNLMNEWVNEWKPLLAADHLGGNLSYAAWFAFLAVFCAGIALAAGRACLGVLELALFAIFAGLAFRHARWIALAALALTPALAILLGAARQGQPGGGRVRRAATALAASASAAFALLGLASLLGFPFDPVLSLALLLALAAGAVALALAWSARRPLRSGLLATALLAWCLAGLAVVEGIPIRASTVRRPWLAEAPAAERRPSLEHRPVVDWLRERGASGHLFTEYHWAAYAIHELWPAVRVFLDSRSEVHGEAILAEYLDAKNDVARARETLERRRPDLVLVRFRAIPAPARNPGLIAALAAHPDYVLLWVDDWAVLYARREAASELGRAIDFDPLRFRPHAIPAGDEQALEAELRRALTRADSAFVRTALAATLRAQGRSREALDLLEATWDDHTRYAGTPQLAGEIHAAAGRHEEARRWFERAIELAPTWGNPRRALRMLDAPSR